MLNKILVIILFLSSASLAQRNAVFSQNSVLGASTTTATYTLNESVTDSVLLYLLTGYVPIKVNTIFASGLTFVSISDSIIRKDSVEYVYFTPNTSTLGSKTGTITINGNKVVNVSYFVEYPDSLLAFDSTSFNFGTLATTYKDLVIKVRNIGADTIDFQGWIGLNQPFAIQTYNQGWYVAPNDSGQFTIRVNHLGVDTTVTQNIGWVYSDIEDNFRDTVWTEFSVVMEVNSNTLLPPTNLVATNQSDKILITWQDNNVSDTVTVYDNNFLLSSDVNMFTASTGTSKTYDVGRMKLSQSISGYSWNDAYLEYTVIQGEHYSVSVDYIAGTDVNGWLVMYNKAFPQAENLLTNQSSTINATFTYGFTSSFTGTLVIKLQVQTSALNQYGHFDNFLFKQTEPSYDWYVVQRQPYYLGVPNGVFSDLLTDSSGSQYYNDFNVINNNTYNYRVQFYKDGEYVTSNEDTSTYIISEIPEEPETDLHNIYADAYVKNGGSTNWASRTDSTTGITIETLLTNIATLGTNKIVAFKSGQYFKKAIYLTGSSYNGLHLTTYGGSQRAKIGLYDTLAGAKNPDNWTDYVADESGGHWTLQINSLGLAQKDYAVVRLWLDDQEYMRRANMEKIYVHPTYHIALGTESTEGGRELELIQDSSWAKYSSIYRWQGDVNENDRSLRIKVWTPDGSKPSAYYSTIKQASYNSTDASWGSVLEFDNIDNLHLSNLHVEGGEFRTVTFKKSDSVIVENCVFEKASYGSMSLYECDNSQILNNVYNGMGADFPAGTRIFDEQGARDGITIDYDSDNNIIKGNKIYNYSTENIRVSSSTKQQTESDGYTNGVPDNNIIDSNLIANTANRWYFRPFQVHGNEFTDPAWTASTYYASGAWVSYNYKAYKCITSHTSTSIFDATKWLSFGTETYTGIWQPKNTIITRNIITNANLSSKNGGNGLVFMYNVYTGMSTAPIWLIDHSRLVTGNNGDVFEALHDTTTGIHYYSNNTFINVQMSLFNSWSINGSTLGNTVIDNNLFLNMATLRKFLINEMNPAVYTASDLDWRIYRSRIGTKVRNNFSYNSNLSSSANRLTFRLDQAGSGTGGTFTYDGLGSLFTSNPSTFPSTNYVSSGNIQVSNGSYTLSTIVPNWSSGNFNISTSIPAYNGGTDISSYIPAYLSKDYFGNTINVTNPNIGAVDN